MTATLLSLLVILVVALAAPVIAAAIPGKPIPEVVFLLFLGALLGPNMAGLVQVDEAVSLVSELGLAFLFLLAGYEVDPRELAGSLGRAAGLTWFVGFGVALVLVGAVLGAPVFGLRNVAVAVALTTTAYGTLAPILKERGLTGTPVGRAVTAHGVVGELFPILAIALLLSTRASWQTLLILLAFVAVAAVLAVVPARARRAGHRLYRAIDDLRDTNAQTLVRFVVVLLLALVSVCSVFGIDSVLGAFVAGFALRFIMPEGDTVLESKLEVVGYSFFIPLFFVVSGAGINLRAVLQDPAALVLTVAMLLLARAVPVYLSTFLSGQTRGFTVMQRLNVALYSTMALPLIVTICKIATTGGFMAETTAGTLMTAGALSVLVMPIATSLTRTVVEAHPVAAIHDLAAHPHERRQVLELYRSVRQEAHRAYRGVRDAAVPEEARDAADVLATFNARRLALLADLRANELDEAADAAGTDPGAWERIAAERRARWEAMKAHGDEAWEHIKQLGDRELDEMSAHGERYLARRARVARVARDALNDVAERHPLHPDRAEHLHGSEDEHQN